MIEAKSFETYSLKVSTWNPWSVWVRLHLQLAPELGHV